MEPIDDIINREEEPVVAPPPETEPVEESSRAGFWQRFWQRLFNREIEVAPAEDYLRNDGNFLTALADRYVGSRHCPYCFAFVSKRVYRVRSRQSDEVLVSGVGMSIPKMKTYECPGCNAELPSDFFANRSTSIAVVGGTDSGKSSFITIFCELLLHRNSALSDLGIFGSIINKEGLEQFESNWRILIRQERPLDFTRVVENPIVVRLHSKHHKRVTYITLLDSPGEYFSNIENLRRYHPNLHFADGIVFLMNPLDIAELLRIVKKEKPGSIPPNLEPNVRNYEIVENMYQMYLQGGRIKPNRQIKTPTAFCLSRADLIDDIESSHLYLPLDFEPEDWGTDEILDDMRLAADDLRELIDETDRNLLNIMDTRFRKHSFFPVSPLGKTPAKDGIGSWIEGGVEPKGVVQPIIWILNQTKFIPNP